MIDGLLKNRFNGQEFQHGIAAFRHRPVKVQVASG